MFKNHKDVWCIEDLKKHASKTLPPMVRGMDFVLSYQVKLRMTLISYNTLDYYNEGAGDLLT